MRCRSSQQLRGPVWPSSWTRGSAPLGRRGGHCWPPSHHWSCPHSRAGALEPWRATGEWMTRRATPAPCYGSGTCYWSPMRGGRDGGGTPWRLRVRGCQSPRGRPGKQRGENGVSRPHQSHYAGPANPTKCPVPAQSASQELGGIGGGHVKGGVHPSWPRVGRSGSGNVRTQPRDPAAASWGRPGGLQESVC
jgi:hypothetical protein